MSPSPPLTDPDVQVSRIRFFTGEFRSRWRKAMDDPRRGKRMALEDRVEAGPVERAFSTMPSRQPFFPQHHDLASEPPYASRVARYAVVGIVASHHLGQMGMLIAQGSMPIASAPLAYRRQRPWVPAFGRHLPHPVHRVRFKVMRSKVRIWKRMGI